MNRPIHDPPSSPIIRPLTRLARQLPSAPSQAAKLLAFKPRSTVEFADWSGLTLRLVYYPPYHSKYNPIERCWSALERKWNGVLLTTLQIVLECALRMCWKGKHPTVEHLAGAYPDGIRVTGRTAKRELESRLERSPGLRKYDIIIRPRQVN